MSAGFLLLEYEPSLVPDGGWEVTSPVAGLVKAQNKDPAGHIFHYYALLQKGIIKLPDPEDDENKEEDESTDEITQDVKSKKLQHEEPPEGTQWKKAKKKKRNVKKSNAQDLYALLGLGNERWTATEAQITKAYRKVALLSHPDKACHACEDEAAKQKVEEKFLLIQEAYEVLSNPTLRREYDSTDNFDDTLPSECAPADFFAVFGPAFRRNTRWSLVKPVPDLGDMETGWEEVEKFYDFWFGFRSWREFPHPDEEDVAGAECRDHRRWMERQNSKLREKSKKDEARRLRDFVESAYKIDPRVSRRKDAQKQARLQKKQEKAEARRKAEEEERERIRILEAEKLAKEEAEKQAAREARRVKEEAKKALKTAKTELEQLCGTENGESLVDGESLYVLQSKLKLEQLTKLNGFLEKTKDNPGQCRKVLKKAVDDLEKEEQDAIKLRQERLETSARALRDAREQELEKKRKQMSEWNQEELRMLDKALKKFPQRLIIVHKGTRKRWEQVAGYIGSRTLDEVLMMVKERKGAASQKFESQENFRSSHKKKTSIGGEPTQSCSFTAEDGGQGSSSKVAVSSETGTWTEEQELALVKALKAFPRDVDQRWDKICEVVPGKTKAQCFKRFKELRETFRVNKAAAP